MNGSSDSDNSGKDNVVVATIAVVAAVDGDSRAIGIGDVRLAMSRMKFRRD
ncbi:hypothetical protein [uncultured Campylobacter sp.]|uniref:hypothetical protein n=1 Tax=uncultured Campylobacter sp. TaxID=218934 RepID=UPI00260C68D6|nr:hypothetical protein [uncultured Campylobacter sp.]